MGGLLLTLLLTLLCVASCTPSGGGEETEAPTPEATADVTEPATEPTVEETTTPAPVVTEPETTEPLFVPTALPAANVAREGFALTSNTKYTYEGTYSNVNLNDGDRSTGYTSEWGDKFDSKREHFLFIDLTEPRVIDSLKLYPLIGDEGGFPVDYDVLISQDGKEYTPHTTVSGMTPEADGYTVDMKGVEAKYVKLVFKKLGAGHAERGVHIAIGELEVYSPIDTATNMQLNLDDIWLFKDPDTTHRLAVTYYRDGTAVDPAKKLTFVSRDPAIATVSEDGLITPVTYGKTEVYVLDGENMATCAVEVMEEPDGDDFLISNFFITAYVTPEALEQSIDLIVKSGVTHFETPHWWDMRNNDIHLYALHLCRERGAMYTPHEQMAHNLNMTDEQYIELLKPYENMAGFYGIFISDEPPETYTDYAEMYNALQTYNPHYTHHMNLLPPAGFYSGTLEYYTEFAAIAGGDRCMKYLTYDHYPFGWGAAFDSWVYYTLDLVRQAGLRYNCDTGYYMQSQIMTPAFDALTLGERRYSASLGMAYGMKNYKHYLGLCPVEYDGVVTDYLSGILKPDYTPADYYDDIVEVNGYIKRMGTLLANADAIEVYHSRAGNGCEEVPEEFFMELVSTRPLIYSVYREIEGTQQYVVLTSKNYNAKKATTLKFIINRDVGAIKVFDPMTGETTDLNYTVGQSFSLDFEPGQSLALILADGADVTCKRVESDNLMLGKGVFVSSSQASFWEAGVIGTRFVTDGDVGNGMWLSQIDDKAPRLILDLGSVQTSLGDVVLYMNDHLTEAQYLSQFTVLVSEDGETYTEVTTVEGATYDNETKSYRVDLGGVSARYIKLTATTVTPVGVGEIEVYRK